VTHFLRHTAVCLWLALLLAGGAGLWLMPALQAVAGLEALPFAAAGMLALAFVGVGWAGTRLGLRRVRRGLQAAEAELRAARAALDRPWVSAAARRRVAPGVGARLARLYLAGGRLDDRGAAFLNAYLRHVPEDEEAAEGWAAQAELRGGLTEEQQELAGRLVACHPDNALIARVAARLFLLLERRDYDALQCYRRVRAGGRAAPEELRAGLARVLGPADGAETAKGPVAVPGAIPAEARPSVRPAERSPERAEPPPAREEREEPEPPFRMSAPAETEVEEEEPQRPGRRAPGAAVREGLRAAGARLSAWRRAWSARRPAALRGAQSLWRTLAARHVLGAAVVAGLGAILVWLVATAMDDYVSRPSEAPATAEAPAAEPPPAITDDPYTLQVAAYLKQELALRRVEELKRKGLEAYWTETSSGGKVYYQVRISHFRDQQSARDFGRSLKGKGLIEDFYVTNYVR
jgi:hypothetical protein